MTHGSFYARDVYDAVQAAALKAHRYEPNSTHAKRLSELASLALVARDHGVGEVMAVSPEDFTLFANEFRDLKYRGRIRDD